MKQTSIEWFNQQLVDKQNGKGDSKSWNDIFEQAKEMHKQEIIDAYYGELYYESSSNGEQYYKETFGE